MDPFPIYRIDSHGQLTRQGVIRVTPPGLFVIQQDDGGESLTSQGLPWWLLDMRPQGFMGRSFAARHGAALGLSASINEWSDRQALHALLQQGHDVVGNFVVGDLSGSFAAGEQPKFTTYAQTPAGPRHVLVKFSLPQSTPANERWRDLLLAEHHALETLRDAGLNAAASWVHDHLGQRFLEAERFDRVGQTGRRDLVSLAALEAEFVGNPRAPWPVLVDELARQNVVSQDAVLSTQTLFAFGRLIGNTDMHTGNLSFLTDGGMPYDLAPAYDMLPMAFTPGANGLPRGDLVTADLDPGVPDQVWCRMRDLAERYLERLKADEQFSVGFALCRAKALAAIQQIR